MRRGDYQSPEDKGRVGAITNRPQNTEINVGAITNRPFNKITNRPLSEITNRPLSEITNRPKNSNLIFRKETKMNVKLLAYTPDPEKTVACAAKLCYAAADIDTVMEGLTEEKTASFLQMLSDIGHDSPIEHASFTFGIEGVSRSFLAEMTRHRIASYSVQSQRYVREDNFTYVVPPEIEEIPEAKEEYLKAMEEDMEHYMKLAAILKEKHIKTFIAEGEDEKTATRKAEKKAIEDARFVLPNACTTKMICSFNARSLRNFFSLRCCNRAQWEIRGVATEMLRLVREVAPNLFAKSGPPCFCGACDQGNMTCGKAKEVRAFFADLK